MSFKMMNEHIHKSFFEEEKECVFAIITLYIFSVIAGALVLA